MPIILKRLFGCCFLKVLIFRHRSDVSCFLQDSGLYKGEWVANRRHGEGNLLSVEQERYSGFWENGMRAGLGSQSYQNFDRYEGQWRKDR